MAESDEPKKKVRARASVSKAPGSSARPRAESASTPSGRPKARARHGDAAARPSRKPEIETAPLVQVSMIDELAPDLDESLVEDAVIEERSPDSFDDALSPPPLDWAIPKAPAVPNLDSRLSHTSSLEDDGLSDHHEFDDDEDDEDDEDDASYGLLHDSDIPVPAVPGGRPVEVPRVSMPAPAPDDESGSILITGICGRLGKLLVRELHRDMHVVGIDRRAFPEAPKDIVHHRFDLRRKKTRDVFRSGRVKAVVHLGVMHDPRSNHRERHSWNVVAFQKLLEYMAQYRVRKLVVLSSANVYGPQADNPQFLTEEAPLLGSQEFYAIRDLVELDMLAQGNFWRNPDVETVILRPCHILGEVRNAPSNYIRLQNPVTILGFDPMVQVIHERDVVHAIRLALEPGVRGVFNLRGPGELPLSRILALAGRKPTPIAAPLARAAIQQLWRLRLASFPAPEIDHIRYVCMVDDSRARQTMGFSPRYSLEDAIAAALSAA